MVIKDVLVSDFPEKEMYQANVCVCVCADFILNFIYMYFY